MLVVVAAAFAGQAALARAQTGPLEDLDAFPRGKLEIADGKKVKHVFEVWLADSPRRQAQGLMFVRVAAGRCAACCLCTKALSP